MSYSTKVAFLHSSALCFPSVLEEWQIKHDIQGDSGPENVDTTEAVSSLRGETRPGLTDIFCLCPFLPSFDMPWVPKSMLFGPNCWRPRESLLFKGIAVVKPPFAFLFEVRLGLPLGLGMNKFSCWCLNMPWNFTSCGGGEIASSNW